MLNSHCNNNDKKKKREREKHKIKNIKKNYWSPRFKPRIYGFKDSKTTVVSTTLWRPIKSINKNKKKKKNYAVSEIQTQDILIQRPPWYPLRYGG